jgi:hypothetical protein
MAKRLRRLLAEGRQAGEGKLQHAVATVSLRVGEKLLDAGHDLALSGRLVGGGRQAGDEQAGGGVGGEQVACNQGMPDGAGLGGFAILRSELAIDMRDHRQHRTGDALPTDVIHRPHLLHAIDRGQAVGERTQRRERGAVEQVARAGSGPDDAIAVGGAEPGSHLIDQPEVGIGVSQQRPQVVVDLQSRQPECGQQRQEADGDCGEESPAVFGRRCSSSGSTIQPRQSGTPQRHGIAASAGQQ